MALIPNVVVVAPGELITAAHLNNIRSNLDRLDTSKVTDTGDTMTGTLIVGGNPIAGGSAGSMMSETGIIASARNVVNSPNMVLNRFGAGNPNGQQIIQFTINATPTLLGSITIATGSSVAYNTTSDPRLKTRDGDLAAGQAAEQAAALGHAVYLGRYNDPETGEATGEPWVLINSTDIEPVAPYAVTGAADAVDADGNIVGQQVNFPALIPLLFAALADALDRITVLEGVAA
jgi:hypothetical protein